MSRSPAVTWSFRWRRLPRWAHASLGAVCLLVGAVMVLRPLTSLAVLVVLVAAAAVLSGVTQWSAARRTDGLADDLIAVLWVIGGVAILLWPGLSVRGLAIGVGVALVVAGGLNIWKVVRASPGRRLATILQGLAELVLGVVALSWPGVTLLVVAVVFGVRTVLFGVSSLWSAIRSAPADVDADEPPATGDTRSVVGFAVGLIVALSLAAVSVAVHRAEPTLDSFYDTPSSVPNSAGELLRIEPFTRGVPAGATGWRILYTTNRDDDRPAVASAIVVAPDGASDGASDGTADGAALPVIAWAHGTTGVARRCAPSALAEPFESGALFVLDEVVEQGWVVVATDYIGLGSEGPHPYLVGHSEGRAVLDAVRAAHQIDELALSDATVVWGHSQGGGAALWAGQLASTYAPELGVVGVAALAPASDPIALADNLATMRGGSILASYVLMGYSGQYPDVRFDDYVRPTARTVVRELAQRCLSEPAMLISVMQSLTTGMEVFNGDLRTGPLADRLAGNTPVGPFAMPLLIGQGAVDPLILPEVQAAYVEQLCRVGAPVDYRTYPDHGHVEVVGADSPLIPDLMEWTRQRLDAAPASTSCR